MCNCCPPAVNALFCLWIRSGCSKASVAGALTFFPPDPPLYKFERYGPDGEPVPDDDPAIHTANNDGNSRNKNSRGTNNDSLNSDDDNIEISLVEDNNSHNSNSDYANDESNLNRTTGRKPNTMSMQSPSAHSMSRDNEDTDKDFNHRQNNNNQRKTNKHPAQTLTDRALALRKKAKIVNERDAMDATMGITYKFIPDPRLTRPPSFSGQIEAVKIGPHRKTGNYVAALIYRVRAGRVTDQTKTIIYSHGNATDIGAMYFMQIILAKGLQCNVVMYDYSGYGESGGVPLENNTYNDVEMVYDYTLSRVVVNREERNIVIYGQSVGSGPSCYIVNNRPGVGGLVLHSPFMSGMRVITPSRYVCWFVCLLVCLCHGVLGSRFIFYVCAFSVGLREQEHVKDSSFVHSKTFIFRVLACLDIFPNINRIKKVQCPVMIIHGVLDEEVHISHGKALHDAVPEQYQRNPWWVRDRGHNDITEGRSKLIEYVQRLKGFLDSLERS